MRPSLRAPVLVPGIATAIGSLPHDDARAAAELSFSALPDLPAAPQLPARDPREGMIAQWLGALPEVSVASDGSFELLGVSDLEPECVLDGERHGGLVEFLAVAQARLRALFRMKAQVTGPLTLGVALEAAGMPTVRAFRRAAALAAAWAHEVERVVAAALPETNLVLFFDEPALVNWRRGVEPLDRELATDVLSGALAGVECTTGVHVCGDGDVAVALAAGPQILGVQVTTDLVHSHLPIARFLDGDGWIAWGAVPTDRPVGESVEPHWRALATVWGELTSCGCDPVSIRARGLVTPACGLAGYGPSQAERVLRLARELAARVHDQAVAARLTLGA